MAITHGPLMSMDASGSVAGAITFSKWKGRSYVRERVIPHNPRSGLQTGMRAWLKFITQAYKNLSAGQKTSWANLAKSTNITALNADVQFNQKRARVNLAATKDAAVITGAVEAAPAGVAATAAPKSVNLVWTDSVGANDYGTMIFQSTVSGFTADISNLIQVIAHGLQKATVPHLVTGTPYFYRVGGFADFGIPGTLAAQVTATPT